MSALAHAFKTAGYETAEERLVRVMSESIDVAEKMMIGAVEKRSLKDPSIAEFSRRVLAENDVRIVWELFRDYRNQALAGLYDKVLRDLRGQMFDNRQTVVGPVRLGTEGQVPIGAHGSNAPTPARLPSTEVTQVASISLLRTFMVNGRPLGEVTAGEARGWAKSRRRDARFVDLLTEGIVDDLTIGSIVGEDDANRAYKLAQAAENE